MELADLGVALKALEGILLGGVAIHQEERDTQSLGLLGNDIEKAQILFDIKEGLGLLESHAGAESAVESDLDGVGEGVFTVLLGRERQCFGVGLRGRGLDLRFGEKARFTLAEMFVRGLDIFDEEGMGLIGLQSFGKRFKAL